MNSLQSYEYVIYSSISQLLGPVPVTGPKKFAAGPKKFSAKPKTCLKFILCLFTLLNKPGPSHALKVFVFHCFYLWNTGLIMSFSNLIIVREVDC